MRPFPGDKGVHALVRRLFEFPPRAAGHHTDAAANLRPAGYDERRLADSAPKPLDQRFAGEARAGLKPQEMAVIGEKTAAVFSFQRRSKPDRICRPGVVIPPANPGF